MAEVRTLQTPVLADVVSNYLRALANLIEWDLSYGGQVWGKGHDGGVSLVNLVVDNARPRLSGATLQCFNDCQKACSSALEKCNAARASEPGCKILALQAWADCCKRCEGAGPS